LNDPFHDKDLQALASLGVKLCVLGVADQPVTTVASFSATLVELNAGGEGCGIGDPGLTLTHSIVKLNAGNNPKITTVAPFAATLVELDARANCGIDDAGLTLAHSIVKLNAQGNPKIKTVAPFAATLVELSASGNCRIRDAGLTLAHSIVKLNALNNAKITTVAPFAATLVELDAFGRHYHEAQRNRQQEDHDGRTVRSNAGGARRRWRRLRDRRRRTHVGSQHREAQRKWKPEDHETGLKRLDIS
jgi:hypothetical protein